MDTNCHKYSTGVLLLGTGNVYEYIKNLLQISKLPLISIGSGNGVIERKIEEKFKINVICIDPTPLSWSLSVSENKLPDYLTMDELINKNKTLIGSCNLFLNWCYPDHTYDIESIILLKPRNLIIITDLSDLHGAGGCAFHDFLKKCGVPTNVKCENEETSLKNKLKTMNENIPKYNFVYRTHTHYQRVHQVLDVSIIWLSLDLTNCNAMNAQVDNSPEYWQAVKEANN
jgi:hypothetical protein